MTGFECYSIYQSVKLHFSSDEYDYFKYNGKNSRMSVSSFEKRKDKYYFHKLARKYPVKDDYVNFLACNFVENDNCWSGNLLEEEAESNYRKHQKILQSFSYFFENECKSIFSEVKNPNDLLKVEDGQHPVLLKSYLQKSVNIETVCKLNDILSFVPVWSKKIGDTIIWPHCRKKIVKFAAFVPKDTVKYKLILKKVINNDL
jgi:hypothetical protein